MLLVIEDGACPERNRIVIEQFRLQVAPIGLGDTVRYALPYEFTAEGIAGPDQIQSLKDFVRKTGQYADNVSVDSDCSAPYAFDMIAGGDRYRCYWDQADYSDEVFCISGRAYRHVQNAPRNYGNL